MKLARGEITRRVKSWLWEKAYKTEEDEGEFEFEVTTKDVAIGTGLRNHQSAVSSALSVLEQLEQIERIESQPGDGRSIRYLVSTEQAEEFFEPFVKDGEPDTIESMREENRQLSTARQRFDKAKAKRTPTELLIDDPTDKDLVQELLYIADALNNNGPSRQLAMELVAIAWHVLEKAE